MPDFQIDKSSGVGSSVIKVNPLEVNKGSTPKMAQLKVTISDGTTKTINLTQNTAQQSYKYFLIVDPTQVPVDPLGGKVEIYVESYREIYLNGQLQGTEKVGYTIQGESGITVNGNTITVGANGTPMDIVRRATVIQDTSGKQVTITIQQTAGQSESSYVFTADPMFVEFDAAGGSQAITITSSKSTMVNGQPPTTVELDYTATISPGFTWDGTRITATENTGTIKTGTLVLTQAESNQEIRIEITQAAGVTEYRFAIKLKSEPEELFRQSMNLNYSATDPETYPISVRTSKFVNGQGQLLGYTMRADASWIQVSNDSFTISANSSESSRSGTITLTQDESGNQCTINIFQQGVSVKEEYTFTILSNFVSIENVGGNTTPFVTSQKIVRRGDQEDIEQVGYSWDLGSLPDWITLDPLTEEFTIEENLDTTRGRTAILQATQEESSKRITLTITQAKAEYTFLVKANESDDPTEEITLHYTWDSQLKEDGWYYRSWLNSDKHLIGFTLGQPSGSEQVDWISFKNPTVADGVIPDESSRPTILVATNNTTSQRTGIVVLYQNRSNKMCTIHIVQDAWTDPYPDYHLNWVQYGEAIMGGSDRVIHICSSNFTQSSGKYQCMLGYITNTSGGTNTYQGDLDDFGRLMKFTTYRGTGAVEEIIGVTGTLDPPLANVSVSFINASASSSSVGSMKIPNLVAENYSNILDYNGKLTITQATSGKTLEIELHIKATPEDSVYSLRWGSEGNIGSNNFVIRERTIEADEWVDHVVAGVPLGVKIAWLGEEPFDIYSQFRDSSTSDTWSPVELSESLHDLGMTLYTEPYGTGLAYRRKVGIIAATNIDLEYSKVLTIVQTATGIRIPLKLTVKPVKFQNG